VCSCPWLLSPMFLDAARDKFFAFALLDLNKYGGKVCAFIDSENTYAPPAKIHAARFARGRNKIRGILAKTVVGASVTPTDRRQHCGCVVFSGNRSWT
jgi:hypothetical protein